MAAKMSQISLRDRERGFCRFFVFPLLPARKHKVNKSPPKCPSHPSSTRCSATPRHWALGKKHGERGVPSSQVTACKWRKPGTRVSLSLKAPSPCCPPGWGQGAGGCEKDMSIFLPATVIGGLMGSHRAPWATVLQNPDCAWPGDMQCATCHTTLGWCGRASRRTGRQDCSRWRRGGGRPSANRYVQRPRDPKAHSRVRGHEEQQFLQKDQAGKGWKSDKGPHY